VRTDSNSTDSVAPTVAVSLTVEWALSLPPRTGVVAASLVAAAVVVDALFVNPPRRA
jgi:hypothetical protein